MKWFVMPAVAVMSVGVLAGCAPDSPSMAAAPSNAVAALAAPPRSAAPEADSNKTVPPATAGRGALVLTLRIVDDSVTVHVNGTQAFTRDILRNNQPAVTVDLSDKLVKGANGISINARNGAGSGSLDGTLTVDGKVIKQWKVYGDSRIHNADFIHDSVTVDYTGTAPSGTTTVAGCTIPAGWAKCRQIASPKITIYGAKDTTDAAMNAVQKIYTDMTSRLGPNYTAAKLDGFTAYVTNGRPWAEVGSLAPVGAMWSGTVEKGMAEGDELRGGASNDFLWIDEQMICKTGIVTRNEANKAGLRATPDNEARTFDQVVHEFGHVIMYRYGLESRINSVYAGSATPLEEWPWTIQDSFGTPAGTPKAEAQKLFDEVFKSKTTYTCADLYK